MKNLLSKIILFSALVFSQEIKSQERDSLNKTGFIKIGAGPYLWDENEFDRITQFSLESEMPITKNASLNFGFDYGAKKDKTEQGDELTKFSIRFGLNNYFLVSDNKKIRVYDSFGINYTLISENSIKIRNGAAIGIDYGGGIENLLSQTTKLFLEIKINKSEIRGQQEKIKISGTSLIAGLKISLEPNKKKSSPYFEGGWDYAK